MRSKGGTMQSLKERLKPYEVKETDTIKTDCHCGETVKWNPYNKVVQCHNCGQIFVPKRS